MLRISSALKTRFSITQISQWTVSNGNKKQVEIQGYVKC